MRQNIRRKDKSLSALTAMTESHSLEVTRFGSTSYFEISNDRRHLRVKHPSSGRK